MNTNSCHSLKQKSKTQESSRNLQESKGKLAKIICLLRSQSGILPDLDFSVYVYFETIHFLP